MDDFQNYIIELKKNLNNIIICGDYNICHKPIDIHDPIRNKNVSGFLPEERLWLDNFINNGFIDSFRKFCNERDKYTWWSYRANSRANNKGWRIDYILVSNSLDDKLINANIFSDTYQSDHCPIGIDLNLHWD
jgi:exodeoxyribonuclease-3